MTSLLLALLLGAPPPLATVGEQSGYTKTGRYAEVEALCAAFPRAYPGKVRCEKFGVTPLGRPLLALAASADGALTPEEAKRRQRPVLLLQGGIHAGEIDGKDAGFALLRDLLSGAALPAALGKVTVLFVPVFNVDGHERFGKNQRPNQNGPEETGWRVTAQNLNLNRDYMKADAPEMQAMLKLLHRWDPVLYADLHVTDGAKFQHDLSVTFEPQQTGPEGLRVLGKALHAGLFAELEQEGHRPLGFYPSFNEDDDPASGFSYGWPPPRFGNAYWAANNRFGLLVETHSWKDYPTRVRATYDACRALVRLASEDGGRWLKAAREADAADERRAGAEVVVGWGSSKQSKPIDFLGYEYAVEQSEVSGARWIRYDDARPAVWKVPFFDELLPAVTVTAPTGGYLVPPPNAGWVAEKLALHGLRWSVVKAGRASAPVETFRIEPAFRPAPFEGRLTVKAGGAWKADAREVPPGTLFVPAGQPHLPLLLDLLEPALPDSLVSWGFFNAYLEQKEYLESYVTEAFAREQLKDPQVKAAFEERLKDPAFAKDPAARLRFFFMRHPAWDDRLGLYPIYRTAEPW